MKIKIEVSQHKYNELKEKMLALGFDVDDDADYILTERNHYWDYISCKKEDTSYHLPVRDIIYIERSKY